MKLLSSINDSLATLGLSPKYLPREKKVKKAYRRMSLIIHPDRAGTGTTKDFQSLQSAYTAVVDFLENRDILEDLEEEDEESSSGESSSVSSDDLTMEEYLAKKYPDVQDKNVKLKIADSTGSSMSDLINYTVQVAEDFYGITNRHMMEVLFLALHPLEEFSIPHADVFWIHKQVGVFSELLLLGDLPTITQENRVVEWLLQVEMMTTPAMVVVMVWQLVMAIKLTGIKPKRMKMLVTGGQVKGKKRREAVVYLSMMHTIGMVMENKADDAFLKMMFTDLENIILEF